MLFYMINILHLQKYQELIFYSEFPVERMIVFFFDINQHVHGMESQMPTLTRKYCVELIAALELSFMYQYCQLPSRV